MPTFLSARRRAGETKQVVLAVVLGVVIVAALGLSIYGFMSRDRVKIPDYPITMRCTKCEHEFGTTQNAAMASMTSRGTAMIFVMDCPKCGEKQTCLEAYECPKCHTKFILNSVKAMFRGDDPTAEKDICPNCQANLAEVEAQKRQEAAANR